MDSNLKKKCVVTPSFIRFELDSFNNNDLYKLYTSPKKQLSTDAMNFMIYISDKISKDILMLIYNHQNIENFKIYLLKDIINEYFKNNKELAEVAFINFEYLIDPESIYSNDMIDYKNFIKKDTTLTNMKLMWKEISKCSNKNIKIKDNVLIAICHIIGFVLFDSLEITIRQSNLKNKSVITKNHIISSIQKDPELKDFINSKIL